MNKEMFCFHCEQASLKTGYTGKSSVCKKKSETSDIQHKLTESWRFFMKHNHLLFILICSILYLSSCTSIPEGANAVKNFDKARYLGTWYEIARLDFMFEKNLNNTTAEYKLNKDNSILVINRGFDYTKNKWKEARGKAIFRGDDTTAELSVSFFGPFYSGYNVLALDSEYKYALVAGKNLSYLWILSREKIIPDDVKKLYLSQARALGYDIDLLVWPQHY